MCGRFAVWQQDLEEEIAAQYPFLDVRRYEPPEAEGGEENQAQFYPRYNIAPRSMSPVIRRMENDDHPGAVLQLMKWGVIPHWQKHETNNLATINARSEALIDGESGIWSTLKGKKRCIVPVNGYVSDLFPLVVVFWDPSLIPLRIPHTEQYEWLKKGNQRLPYYMKRKDDKPLLLAGLWDITTLEDHKYPTYSFTIITTSSNSQLSFIHDRMPVFLEDESSIQTWLNPEVGWGKDLAQMMKPYEHEVSAYQVPKEVGKVGTNDPSFVKPVAERKDGIAAMFKKQKETGAHLKTPSSSQGGSQNLSSSLKHEEDEEEDEQKPSRSQSPPKSSQPSGSKRSKTVSESEKMTLGDAKVAQKRAREENEDDVVEVDDTEVEEIAEQGSSSAHAKKKPRKTPSRTKDVDDHDKPSSEKKKQPTPSPKKKKAPVATAPTQKAKITDFFKK
ncbi:hypothetical protein FRB90_007313 [Tulasnella sp. 427]|nr:hypothetical protein FRB90_007313 [Tulasnella sp. 427]